MRMWLGCNNICSVHRGKQPAYLGKSPPFLKLRLDINFFSAFSDCKSCEKCHFQQHFPYSKHGDKFWRAVSSSDCNKSWKHYRYMQFSKGIIIINYYCCCFCCFPEDKQLSPGFILSVLLLFKESSVKVLNLRFMDNGYGILKTLKLYAKI